MQPAIPNRSRNGNTWGNRFLTVAAVSSGGADQMASLKISTSMSPA
jgi:hypothetical protein